jgi:hypothetical protein
MSHTVDYLTWLSGRDKDNAPRDEAPRADQVRKALHNSSGARAAEDLIRLCLKPLAGEGVQLRPAQAPDTTKQKGAGEEVK